MFVFTQLLKGVLPVTLMVTDIDKENTSNSKFDITMVSQTPAEPKIGVEQLQGGLARLTLKGCFDYDVRFIAIFLLNLWKVNVHANKHVEFSNISNIFYIFQKATKYTIVLQAKDRGTKPKTQSSTAVVTLNIVDANTHQPRFKERQVPIILLTKSAF